MHSGIVTRTTLVMLSLHTPFESGDCINNKSSKIPAVALLYTEAGHLNWHTSNKVNISAGLKNPALDLEGSMVSLPQEEADSHRELYTAMADS